MIDSNDFYAFLATNNNVQDALNFWADYFETTDGKVLYPILLKHKELVTMYTPEFGKRKMAGKAYYQQIFNLTPSQIGKFLRERSSLATLSTDSKKLTSFQQKIAVFQEQFDFSLDETLEILRKNPALVGLNLSNPSDDNSINAKILKVRKFLSNDEIVSNPRVLNVPAQKFTLRYMISVIANCKSQFISGGFMTSEKVAYSRFEHLSSIGALPISSKSKNKNILYLDEASFVKKYGITTSALMATYPLDQTTVSTVVPAIEKQYAAVAKRPISLTQKEKDAIL